MSGLTWLGVGHRSVDPSTHAALALSSDEQARVLRHLREQGCRSALVVSTCNRTEILCEGAVTPAVEAWASARNLPVPELVRTLRRVRDYEAAVHLARVVAGMESAVLGEPEIVAQVKDAWRLSDQHALGKGAVGSAVQAALRASRRVRTETGIARGVLSYAVLGVREASVRIGGYTGQTVRVVGTGTMAQRVLKELERTPPALVIVQSRSLARAEGLASALQARLRIVPTTAPRALGESAVFLAGDHPVELLAPKAVVDFGVPAHLPSAALAGLRDAYLGMDAMIARCEAASRARQEAKLAGEEIVSEVMGAWWQRFQERR